MNREKIVNLTPHSVRLVRKGEPDRVWDSPKIPLPRLVEEIEDREPIDGVPINCKKYGKCENLPALQEGVYYIVSGLIAQAMRRADLLIPNTIRDEKGQIIGCDSFAVMPEEKSEEQ